MGNSSFSDVDKIYQLGLLFLNEKNEPGIQAKAASYLKKAAESGHVDAMYELGLCYRWGDGGVYADPDEAMKWFILAMNGSHEKAKALAENFNSPSGKQILLESAISGAEGYGTKWYKSKTFVDGYYQMAEEGNAEAQYELARQLENPNHVGPFVGDINESIKWYERAADNDVIDAMFNLAMIYRHVKMGIPVNKEKALYWMQMAAEKGDDEARTFVNKWNKE